MGKVSGKKDYETVAPVTDSDLKRANFRSKQFNSDDTDFKKGNVSKAKKTVGRDVPSGNGTPFSRVQNSFKNAMNNVSAMPFSAKLALVGIGTGIVVAKGVGAINHRIDKSVLNYHNQAAKNANRVARQGHGPGRSISQIIAECEAESHQEKASKVQRKIQKKEQKREMSKRRRARIAMGLSRAMTMSSYSPTIGEGKSTGRSTANMANGLMSMRDAEACQMMDEQTPVTQAESSGPDCNL